MEKRNSAAASFLITDLPDSLLLHIVELLPIKSAVATTLISSRFRRIWKSARRLDFDSESLGIIPRTCSKISQQEQLALRLGFVVDGVLAAHPNPISACRISHYHSNCAFNLPRWVDCLKRRGIQELNLVCYGPYMLPFQDEIPKPISKFPSGVFACGSLRVLELKWFGLEDAGPFAAALNLVSLTLQGVALFDETLCGLLQHCARLETLVLLRCSCLKKVKIHAASLNRLELIQGEAGILRSIDIDIPKAAKLVLDVVDCEGPVEIVAPDLQFLFAHRSSGPDGWSRRIMLGCKRNLDAVAKCFGVYGIRSMERYPFVQLQRLAIEVDLNDPRDASVVAFILRSCHHLHELDIKNSSPNCSDKEEKVGDSSSKHECLPYPESEFWKRQDSFDCVVYVLRSVKLRGITGQCLELEFAKYIMAAAARLQKMLIHLASNCSEEDAAITRQSLSLPAISLHAQITILN
ncbi:hypothetical protein ACLOJK_008454 [Asimina triloba]